MNRYDWTGLLLASLVIALTSAAWITVAGIITPG
jgi:hypothetical protein